MPISSLISLRLGKVLSWKFNNFLTRNTNTFKYLDFYILSYYKSIFNSLNLNHKKLVKTHYSLSSLLYLKKSKFKSSILLGNSFIKFKNNTIFIYLNYYFDEINSHPDKIYYFNLLLTKATYMISQILGTKTTLINFNYNSLFIKNINALSLISSTNLQLLKLKCNIDLNYIIIYYTKIKNYYDQITKNLFYFKTNQYFFRILNVIYSSFLLKKIDLIIITNSISIELSKLRKQHKRFIYFLKKLFNLLFTMFKSKKKLYGLRIFFTGRITLFNRETQRSVKKLFYFGKSAISSNLSLIIEKSEAITPTRYGVINIILSISYLNTSFIYKPVFFINHFFKIPVFNFLLLSIKSLFFSVKKIYFYFSIFLSIFFILNFYIFYFYISIFTKSLIYIFFNSIYKIFSFFILLKKKNSFFFLHFFDKNFVFSHNLFFLNNLFYLKNFKLLNYSSFFLNSSFYSYYSHFYLTPNFFLNLYFNNYSSYLNPNFFFFKKNYNFKFYKYSYLFIYFLKKKLIPYLPSLENKYLFIYFKFLFFLPLLTQKNFYKFYTIFSDKIKIDNDYSIYTFSSFFLNNPSFIFNYLSFFFSSTVFFSLYSYLSFFSLQINYPFFLIIKSKTKSYFYLKKKKYKKKKTNLFFSKGIPYHHNVLLSNY